MDRIKLTDEDIETFSSDEELVADVDILVSVHTSNDDAPELKKQILDDYEFRNKIREADGDCGTFPSYEGLCDKIEELKEKAKTLDACGDLIGQVNHLLQENKHLKEELQQRIKNFEELGKIDKNLKENEKLLKTEIEGWKNRNYNCQEIVQKVRELTDNEIIGRNYDILNGKLKEILGEP